MMRRRNLITTLGAGLAAVGLGGRASGADATPKAGSGRGPQPGGLLVPTRMFLATGVGEHVRQARADDLCLVHAGIGNCNRVEVSSIVPPGCRMIPREEGQRFLK